MVNLDSILTPVSATTTLAGNVTFTVLSLIVKLPLIVFVAPSTTLSWLAASNAATPVIWNEAVGYFSTSKKSALFKCPVKSSAVLPPDVAGSTEASSVDKELLSKLNSPPVTTPFSTETVPVVFTTPNLGFNPPL